MHFIKLIKLRSNKKIQFEKFIAHDLQIISKI